MKLLVIALLVGVPISLWAGDRVFLEGEGQCTYTIPKTETVSCSVSYLILHPPVGDTFFKVTVNVDSHEPIVFSGKVKTEGPKLVTVYDAQGENKVGSGEREGSKLLVDFTWSPEGEKSSVTVSLAKDFVSNEEGLPIIELSGSMTHPFYGADPYFTFKGTLVTNTVKTSCLFHKEPADCGL